MKSSPRSGHYRYDHPGPGRCHPVITVSAGDRRRQDSPLCDRHLPRHVRAVNHRLNGKARRLCLRASGPRMLHRDPGRVHAPTRALISRQDTQAGCQQTRIEPPRRHGAERVGKKGRRAATGALDGELKLNNPPGWGNGESGDCLINRCVAG